MESIGKIRLKYYRKGKTIREIVRETGVSRNTVRKVLRNDETLHKYQREVIHKPKQCLETRSVTRLVVAPAL